MLNVNAKKKPNYPKLRTEYELGSTGPSSGLKNKSSFIPPDPSDSLHKEETYLETARFWSSAGTLLSNVRSGLDRLLCLGLYKYLLSSQRLHPWREPRGGAADSVTGAH